jgi:hypothetical protein
MKLYARLENNFSENDHVIDEVIRYYTEQEVLNEYWSYWIGRTYSSLTKENCLTDWLNTYKGWVDVSNDDDTEVQAYNIAQDEILATQHKILDELLGKNELEYNKIMKQEQYIHIDTDGDKFYYKDRVMTMLHRIDGPAFEGADGHKQWWVDNKLHRLDGPAIISANGSKEWYVDGNRHRTDGPAIEWSDGDKSWYVDNKRLTKQEFLALTSPTLELTLEDIAIKYGVDASKVKIKK